MVAAATAIAAPAWAAIEFESQVRPIFAEHCTRCHGEERQKGNLRLDSPAGILRGGDSGEPLFIPGDKRQSHLFKLVSRHDPDEAMPPEESGPPLAAEQVATLGAWIDQGAPMPAVDPAALAPQSDHWSLKAVKRPPLPAGNGDHPVDRFITAKLGEHGLSLSAPAQERLLARRLYLVAHGLPPSQSELDQFLTDQSPEAWAGLVDSVLASPRFGERLARYWLDVVRFAETNGFETNRERPNAYHYRDYVIAAFNDDKPYDEFVREQLAGDAYGEDVATGFLVAGPHDVVKSPDPKLTLTQRQDELADMVNTTGTAFLGLSLGCARCHNHKFDPVSQKDYYSMQAVFAGVSYGDRALEKNPGTVEQQAIVQLRRETTEIEASIDELRGRAQPTAQSLDPPVSFKLNHERFPATRAKFVRFTVHQTTGAEPCIDELMIFDSASDNVARTARPSSSGNLPGFAIHQLGFINDGKFGNSRSWIADTERSWIQLEFAEPAEIHRIEWGRDREGKYRDRLPIDYTIESSLDGATWSPLASSAGRQPFGAKGDPHAFIAKLPAAEADRARGLITSLAEKRKRLESLQRGATAWVGNFKQPGPTHRLYRGDPMAKREIVAPDALEVLGSLGLETGAPEQQRRVALAGWIASASNPLTARVMVNRLWQFVFGTGLVATASDFGGNGTPPTHPQLLDWLAAEFVEHDWSVKHVLRLMLTSQTFRQSSQPRPQAIAVDAGARYLWRFPPRRLEAEAIRDSILAVSGSLDLVNAGGPGFYLLEVDRENVVHYHPKTDTGPAEWRRMIYMFKVRQEQDAVFGAFDCPDGNQVIPKRTRSTTPLQALNLFNSQFVVQQAEILADHLAGHTDPAAHAYQRLYGRPASAEELRDARELIGAHGVEAFCRAMLNTSELLFIF